MKTIAKLAGIVLLAGSQFLGLAARADDEGAADNVRRPIQAQTPFTIAAGASGTQATMFTVPDGAELELEFLSCSATVPSGQTIFPSLRTTGGGVQAAFGFLPVEQPNAFPAGSAVTLLIFSQPVHIFADPNTAVALEVEDSTAQTAGSSGACSFAGQLLRSNR